MPPETTRHLKEMLKTNENKLVYFLPRKKLACKYGQNPKPISAQRTPPLIRTPPPYRWREVLPTVRPLRGHRVSSQTKIKKVANWDLNSCFTGSSLAFSLSAPRVWLAPYVQRAESPSRDPHQRPLPHHLGAVSEASCSDGP